MPTNKNWKEDLEEMWRDKSFGGVVETEVRAFIIALLTEIITKIENKKLLNPGEGDAVWGHNKALEQAAAIINSYL